MTAILAVPVVAIAQILHKAFVEYKDEEGKDKWIKIFDDLLHHTDEWRKNADRARARDAKKASMRPNGAGDGGKGQSGFDNLALENEDEPSHSRL